MRATPILMLAGLWALAPAAMPQQANPPAPRSAEQMAAEVNAAERRVTAAVRALSSIRVTDFEITPHAGILVVGGMVNSEEERSRVLDAAAEAAGDVRVISRMTVRPLSQQPEKMAALQLVRRVETTLQRDPRTANLGVSVSIDDKSVIGLHGLVPSREDRAMAETVAKTAPGVRQIRNHLVVPSEERD